MSVHVDRGGGDLHVVQDIRQYGRRYRMVVCRPEHGPIVAPLLLPGGVLLAWSDSRISSEEATRLADAMRDAGLDGVGYGSGEHLLFWGVADIGSLTARAILRAHMSVRR
jgi:hypothetical protein